MKEDKASPVGDMIVQDLVVTAVLVVVASVLGGDLFAVNFVGRQAQIPNLRILLDLGALEFCQSGAVILYRFLGCHWQPPGYFFPKQKHISNDYIFRSSRECYVSFYYSSSLQIFL